MRYSPLCDTSLVAYLAYLASVSKNGASAGRPLQVDGGDRVDEVGDGGHDASGGIVGVFRGLLREAKTGLDGVDFVTSTPGVRGYVRGIVGDSTWGDEEPVTGMAGGNGCGGQRCLDYGVRPGVDGCVESRGVDPSEDGQAGGSVLQDEKVVDPVVVESKTERNRRWRREKKEKKNRRRKSQFGSVSGSGLGVESSGRAGFFSECPDGVQRELRDTRAELMIARNRHDKMVVERKTAELGSNVQVVSDAMKFMRLQAQLAALERKNIELVGKSRVGGWARTVLSGATDSFVSKAASERSSVPSLESVGASESASQPSADDDARMSLRRVEYNIAVQQMELDLGPYYTASDYNRGIELVREAFSDLVFSDTENALRAVGRKIVEKVGFESDPDLIKILYEEDMIDLPDGYFEDLNARRSVKVDGGFEDY